MHLSMFCPRMGGGGATPGEFENFRSSNVNFPSPGHLVNVKFPISPLKFLTQQTIFDVKIPTLGELHDAKFLWAARADPTPPPLSPILGQTIDRYLVHKKRVVTEKVLNVRINLNNSGQKSRHGFFQFPLCLWAIKRKVFHYLPWQVTNSMQGNIKDVCKWFLKSSKSNVFDRE